MAVKPSYAELEQRVKDLERQLAGQKNQQNEIRLNATAKVRQENAHDEDRKRILVIDDSKVDRMILEEILNKAGYAVVLASDGQQGLERFYEDPADLVITDMIMPGKMGIDLILEIREKFPEQKIVAISGGSDFGPEIELSMAQDLKAHTVTKPFDPEQILKIVDELLPRESAQEKHEPEERGNPVDL